MMSKNADRHAILPGDDSFFLEMVFRPLRYGRGHLMIEQILEASLTTKVGKRIKNFSFYKKVKIFEEMVFENKIKHTFVIEQSNQLNKIRNELAHDALFQIVESDIMN